MQVAPPPLLPILRSRLQGAILTRTHLDPDREFSLGELARLTDGSTTATSQEVAILANEGLRPTSTGGHIATYDAVAAQLVPPLGSQLSAFHRMRRMRNSNEYPNFDEPNAEPQDILDDLPQAEAIIGVAERVLDQMPVY
jgi:hypothetical protein